MEIFHKTWEHRRLPAAPALCAAASTKTTSARRQATKSRWAWWMVYPEVLLIIHIYIYYVYIYIYIYIYVCVYCIYIHICIVYIHVDPRNLPVSLFYCVLLWCWRVLPSTTASVSVHSQTLDAWRWWHSFRMHTAPVAKCRLSVIYRWFIVIYSDL